MMHRAWCSIVEVPYCFSRSCLKFQGHTALKIVEFDPNLAFPDCYSSLNSSMAMKCCTKLETAKERCPIVFQGHRSNFKVTRYKTSPILTQIGRFRIIGRSQLSNPSDCLVLGHASNFKVTRAEKSMIWIKFEQDYLAVRSYQIPQICLVQGHLPNFKVRRLKKSSNLTQIGRFQTLTPVWIHQWLWNDAQSLE